jgi:glutamate-5-semialdehyde dehydrogenase
VTDVRQLAERARAASRKLGRLDRAAKDRALSATARLLRAEEGAIVAANARDVERARAAGLTGAMVDRLDMGPKTIAATAAGVEHVVSLADPVGSRSGMQRLQNGLLVGRQRLPLGVVAMVYEARPSVTIDAAVLCLKAGNAVLLRGGKEAADTNRVLGGVLRRALVETGLPEDAVGIVEPTDREGIREMVSLSGLIDLVIPRGGEGLIRFVAENARVPVLNHYKGVCHLFLDEGCNPRMALDLTVNGKVSRPGVCNALECLLVHEAVARSLLPDIGRALVDRGVQIRGCPRTCEIIEAVRATDDDWGREFLDLVLAVRLVRDIDGALEHIDRYGSNHTEAICTESHTRAQRWLREVDASCVLVNASTRFNDGGQLGLGAEIGISTSKLHAYGPMGLEGLTAEKWVVLGDGQVRG